MAWPKWLSSLRGKSPPQLSESLAPEAQPEQPEVVEPKEKPHAPEPEAKQLNEGLFLLTPHPTTGKKNRFIWVKRPDGVIQVFDLEYEEEAARAIGWGRKTHRG